MKVYEAIYKEGETEGVYGISLVENPAMEDEWIALSEQKQEIQFTAVDGKRNLLLGAVLRPNQKTYRNIGGNEFYITFTTETIGTLAHNFIKNGFQNSSSEEHEVKLSDVSFVESWQVEDSQKDKSALYGKNYEVGTWVTMAKVSDEIYEKATNGTFTGFSIDAILGLQEINFNNQIEMNEEIKKSIVNDVIDGVKALFTSKEEVNEQPVEETVEAQEVVSEEVNEPAFDAEAFARELKETLSVEFKSMLDAKLSEKDAVIETQAKEVETLKAELNKQPEEESVAVTPQVTQFKKVEIGSNRPRTIQDRVFAAFND